MKKNELTKFSKSTRWITFGTALKFKFFSIVYELFFFVSVQSAAFLDCSSFKKLPIAVLSDLLTFPFILKFLIYFKNLFLCEN